MDFEASELAEQASAKAQELTQDLLEHVEPQVLDKVLILLEKALRRLSIQKILSEHDKTN
jgi:hypothetical protein